MQSVQRRLLRLLVSASVILAVSAPAAAFGASGQFQGGPDQYPSQIPNDHTPVAVHFAAGPTSGLEPNTSYFLKVRYTVSSTPAGGTNRGFTWRASTPATPSAWAQERDGWSACPTVTTDGSGAIPYDSAWVFVKFGDDTIPTSQYHLMVSLSKTGVSSTLNGSSVPTITVYDVRTDGGWAHNGVATGASANTPVWLSDVASTTVYSQQLTESNGVVDDEGQDPPRGNNVGDFRVFARAGQPVSFKLGGLGWAPGDGFQLTVPDTDIAVGASDMVAPTAPSSPSATSGNTVATVRWSAASDNNAVAGYYVYRWIYNPLLIGAAYSPARTRLPKLAASARSFTDTGLLNDAIYQYEIRAFDAAGNVGPRSATVTATPVSPAVDMLPVYRFYQKKNGSHFYTSDPAERDNVIAKYGAVYKFEGEAYSVNRANPANNAPLFRFYNKKNGSHFYTASVSERDRVLATLSATYTYDGPAYDVCLSAPPVSDKTVHRFYNKKNGSHFYTADPAEKALVETNLSATYAYDGPGFFLAP
ncbi:MAG: hypothetical protein WCI74_05250 [Actinomycetes bacterium]